MIGHQIPNVHDICNNTRFESIQQRLVSLESRPPVPQLGRTPFPFLPPVQKAAAPAPPLPPAPPVPRPRPRSPSPPPRGRRYDDDMVAGKAPPPGKFSGDRDALEGWLLQLHEYFTITLVRNELQRMAFIGLCLEGKALEWWKANKSKYTTWREAQDGLRLYYRDHYKRDRSYSELLALKQTGTVQDYLTEIDRLNTYAGIPDSQVIAIMP